MRKGFSFVVLVLFAAAPMFASSFYQGSDTACFNPGFSTGCTLLSTPTGIGLNLAGNHILTYTPDTADFTAPNTGGDVQLGTFFVTPSLLGADGGTFDINILFSQPGGGGNTYTATTLGLVIFGALGAEVTFQQPTTQLYSYPGGMFDVSLPSSPILIGSGQTVALDAFISPVPEPRLFGFLACGLLLIGFVAYRRRNSQSAPVQS